MKIALALILVVASSSVALAQSNNRGFGGGFGGDLGFGGDFGGTNSHSVRGHFQDNGTYVQPHYRTNPNNSLLDNYSTSGNYNPYTGAPGRRKPW